MTENVKKSSIYTRTGDAGTSSLYTGARKPKDDQIFQALGAGDELSAHLGVAREYCVASDNGLADMLEEIQSRLIDVMSSIATPRNDDRASDSKLKRTEFPEDRVEEVEKWIDFLDAELPPLTRFILPSGGLASAHLHVARSVARRLERKVVPLGQAGSVEPAVLKYLNRLSDFLFVAARSACFKAGSVETTYKQGEKTVNTV